VAGQPRRPELAQQGGQVGLVLDVGHLGLAPLPPAEGVQDQERLVRGALAAPAPQPQPVELLEDALGVHGHHHPDRLAVGEKPCRQEVIYRAAKAEGAGVNFVDG
jgi:hypothetical protein